MPTNLVSIVTSFQILLAIHFVTSLLEAWAVSIIFSLLGALSLSRIRTSSLLASLCNKIHACWRKEKSCGTTSSQSELNDKPQNSDTEEKETSTPATTSTTRTHAGESGNQTSPQASPRGPPQKDHHNSSKSPLLTKDFKSLHRNKILTSSFDSLRLVLFFLLFSFPLFTPLSSSFFSAFLPSFLIYLSHLPLVRFSSCIHSPVFSYNIKQLDDFLLCQVPQAFLWH